MSGEAVLCAYCGAPVHELEVFPTAAGVAGSACLPCYVANVDAKRTDADRFASIMGAFGGEKGASK